MRFARSATASWDEREWDVHKSSNPRQYSSPGVPARNLEAPTSDAGSHLLDFVTSLSVFDGLHFRVTDELPNSINVGVTVNDFLFQIFGLLAAGFEGS